MLLEQLMPVYDVVERHRTVVEAAPETVFAAIRTADLGGGALVRALLAARAAPGAAIAFMRSPRRAAADLRAQIGRRRGQVRLDAFLDAGFAVVAERAPDELVIGLLGRFWTPGGDLCRGIAAETFSAGPPPGYAMAGWNFTVRGVSERRTELGTETRVRCAPDAALKFRAYWMLVRPGSGLIRRAMLKSIRNEAERRRAEIP